jgi:hypothetical protein
VLEPDGTDTFVGSVPHIGLNARLGAAWSLVRFLGRSANTGPSRAALDVDCVSVGGRQAHRVELMLAASNEGRARRLGRSEPTSAGLINERIVHWWATSGRSTDRGRHNTQAGDIRTYTGVMDLRAKA